MRAFSDEGVLHQTVRLHGIQVGRPVDLLLERGTWRALGFDVLCGDEVHRFLPYAAASLGDDRIRIRSSLVLLEDIGFYRMRGQGARALRGGAVTVGGRPAGTLRDLVLDAEGVAEVVVDRGGVELLLPADASLAVEARSPASAA